MTAQTATQTAEAADISWPAVRITATHITALQLARTEKGLPSLHAALVQYRDGSLDVLADITALDLPDDVIVLRYPGRAWADDLVAGFRDQFEESGAPIPPLGTLRAMAGREATAELAAEARVLALSALREAAADDLLAADDQADDDVVVDLAPIALPDPHPAAVRRGRHVAPRSAATAEREEQARWAFALEVLEEGDPVAA